MSGGIILFIAHGLSILIRQSELRALASFVLPIHSVDSLIKIIEHCISHVSELRRALRKVVCGQIDEIYIAVLHAVRPVALHSKVAPRGLYAALCCSFVCQFIQVDNFTCEHAAY